MYNSQEYFEDAGDIQDELHSFDRYNLGEVNDDVVVLMQQVDNTADDCQEEVHVDVDCHHPTTAKV